MSSEIKAGYWNVFERKITPVVPGTMATPFETSWSTSSHTYQFSFGNGWFGVMYLHAGFIGGDAEYRVFLCQFDAEGNAINGTIRTIDHTNFLTYESDGYQRTNTWKSGETSYFSGASQNCKTIAPGVVMMSELYATRDGNVFTWGDNGYPHTEARAWILKWDGTTWSFETTVMTDFRTNPFGLPAYADYKVFPASHASPFKDGIMLRGYIRVPTDDAELPNGRYVEWGQYVSYVNDTFSVGTPFVITDIFALKQSYLTPLGIESNGALVQIGGEFNTSAGGQEYFAWAINENGLIDKVNIDVFKGAVNAPNWGAQTFSGESQNAITKVREDKFLVFMETLDQWPYPMNIGELFFDGTNLTLGQHIYYEGNIPNHWDAPTEGIIEFSHSWDAKTRPDGKTDLIVTHEANYQWTEPDPPYGVAYNSIFPDMGFGEYVSGWSSNPSNWEVVEYEPSAWDTLALAFYTINASIDGNIQITMEPNTVPLVYNHYPELHTEEDWYKEGLKGTWLGIQQEGTNTSLYVDGKYISLYPAGDGSFLSALHMLESIPDSSTHITYGPEQANGHFSSWEHLDYLDTHHRYLTYPTVAADKPDLPINRESWNWDGHGIIVHWFSETRYVFFLFEAYDITWDKILFVFEFWDIDDNGYHHLDRYVPFVVQDWGGGPIDVTYEQGRRSSHMSNICPTGDPDVFFAGVYGFTFFDVSGNNDVVDRAGHIEGFLINVDGTVEQAGTSNFLQGTSAGDDIKASFDGVVEDIRPASFWMSETEHKDLYACGASFHFNGSGDDERTIRPIFTIKLDINAKSFEVVDAIFPGYMMVVEGSNITRWSSSDAHGFGCDRNGNIVMLSSWASRLYYSHYVDRVSYSSTGVLSNFTRNKTKAVVDEQRTERPECWIYTFAVGGYGIPHAWGDRTVVLPDGRLLMSLGEWVEFYRDSSWSWDGAEWTFPSSADMTPADPLFGSLNHNIGYGNCTVLRWYAIDASTGAIENKGWDHQRIARVPPRTTTYNSPDDGGADRDGWDIVARHTPDNKIVWSSAQSINVQSVGYTWAQYDYGIFDISNIHLAGNYIKEGEDQVHLWPGFENFQEPEVGNAWGVETNWVFFMAISPSGKRSNVYAQGGRSAESFNSWENNNFADYMIHFGEVDPPPKLLVAAGHKSDGDADSNVGFAHLATSYNTQTWTQSITDFAGVDSAFTCIGYGQGGWVVGGYENVGNSLYEPIWYKSIDGIEWTKFSGPGSWIPYGIHYANGVWVTVGDGGHMATSRDLENWTWRNAGFGSDTIRSVDYGNGIWIAVGDNGKVASSSNLIIWTQQDSDLGLIPLFDIATDGFGRWVICGLSSGVAASNDNGLTWSSLVFESDEEFRGVDFFNQVWVLASQKDIYYSFNAYDYKMAERPLPDSPDKAWGVHYGNGFYSVGSTGWLDTSESDAWHLVSSTNIIEYDLQKPFVINDMTDTQAVFDMSWERTLEPFIPPNIVTTSEFSTDYYGSGIIQVDSDIEQGFLDVHVIDQQGAVMAYKRFYPENMGKPILFWYQPNTRWKIYASEDVASDINVEVTMGGVQTHPPIISSQQPIESEPEPEPEPKDYCCAIFSEMVTLPGYSHEFEASSGGAGARLNDMYLDFGEEGLWYLYEFSAGNHEAYISGIEMKRDIKGRFSDYSFIEIAGEHPDTHVSTGNLDDYFYTKVIDGELRANEEIVKRVISFKEVFPYLDGKALLFTRITETYGAHVVRLVDKSEGFPLKISDNVITFDPPAGFSTTFSTATLITMTANKIAVVISYSRDSDPWGEEILVYFCTWSGTSWSVGVPIPVVNDSIESYSTVETGLALNDSKIAFWSSYDGEAYIYTVTEDGVIFSGILTPSYSQYPLGTIIPMGDERVAFVDTQYGYDVGGANEVLIVDVDTSDGVSLASSVYTSATDTPGGVIHIPFDIDTCTSFALVDYESGMYISAYNFPWSDELPIRQIRGNVAPSSSPGNNALIKTGTGFHHFKVNITGSSGSISIVNNFFPADLSQCT